MSCKGWELNFSDPCVYLPAQDILRSSPNGTAYLINVLLYFFAVLCAERVGQMTKTYNDIDAVTRLLEEVRTTSV